jgi:hypothetical protein
MKSSQIQGGAEMQAKNVRFFRSFALVLGLAILAAPAFGQGVAFQASSLPQQARFEGVTETMGAVVLLATGSGRVPSGSSITVVYSGTVTNSPSLFGLSGSFAGVACAGVAIAATVGPPPTPAVPACSGEATSAAAPSNTIGTGTAAPGFAVTAASNQLTIQITNGPVTTPATATGTPSSSQMGFAYGDYIVISQVRVNVNALGASVTTITAQMSGTSSLPTSNPITFTNATVPVAAVVNPSLTVKVTSAGSIQTCNIGTPTFTVKVTENYPAALTSLVDETGFTPTVLPAPTSGSQVIVTVTGVPAGMAVSVASPATTTLSLTNAGSSLYQASTGGALQWGFVVTGDSTSIAENVTLTFTIGVPNSGNTAVVAGSIASIGTTVTPTVTVTYGPGISSTSLPLTPTQFANVTEGTGSAATIGDCVTNLLFPFITNQVGFDTSVQIANTTADKLAFSSGNASAQNGTCTMTFYPTDLTTQTATAAGTIGTPAQATTPVIPAGGVYSFQQSGSSFKNQSGYLFAVCRFVDGHGFSWVGNASPAVGTSAATISQGLLALVIPQLEVGAARRLGAFGAFATGVTYESLAH